MILLLYNFSVVKCRAVDFDKERLSRSDFQKYIFYFLFSILNAMEHSKSDATLDMPVERSSSVATGHLPWMSPQCKRNQRNPVEIDVSCIDLLDTEHFQDMYTLDGFHCIEDRGEVEGIR